jgi:hypothetical protein
LLFNLPEGGRYLVHICGSDAPVPRFLVFAALA